MHSTRWSGKKNGYDLAWFEAMQGKALFSEIVI
jgi:hypothetical protein